MSNHDIASIYAKPDAVGDKYGVCIGDWRNRIDVFGFATMQDAYYWCVQTLCIDPLVTIPDRFRMWIHEKPQRKYEGLPLLEGLEDE